MEYVYRILADKQSSWLWTGLINISVTFIGCNLGLYCYKKLALKEGIDIEEGAEFHRQGNSFSHSLGSIMLPNSQTSQILGKKSLFMRNGKTEACLIQTKK